MPSSPASPLWAAARLALREVREINGQPRLLTPDEQRVLESLQREIASALRRTPSTLETP